MTLRVSIIGIALIAVAAGSARAQQPAAPSLAEVARQAEAAKATVKKAKKTYTNTDLSSDPRSEPAPPPAAGTGLVSEPVGKAVPAGEMVERSKVAVETEALPKESEENWRMRAASLRKQIDQLRDRLTQLSAVRAETPAQQALNGREIANTQTGLNGLRQQWSRFESSARELKLPMAWIEPLPTFPQ